jgi:hypothetical protein
MTVETWKYSDPVPEWLSDRAKINAIDSNTGNPLIDITETNTGGYEVKDSTGRDILFRTKNRNDLVCFCSKTNRIFVLTSIQAHLIYGF